MICWSCDKNAGSALLCGHCGALQAPDTSKDHFAVLGFDRRFALDPAELERRYKDQARVLHPDRWAKADAQARRYSLQRSVQLNDAWKTLRDPVRRAEYLLSLHGVEVGGEEGTRRTTAAGDKERVPVPQALLMEIMELREELMVARLAEEHARVAALGHQVSQRREAALDAVAAALAQDPPAIERAAHELVAVRYFDRFLEEVEAHAEARLAGGADVSDLGAG